MEKKKIIDTPTCDRLREIDATVLLRAMSIPEWTKNEDNLPKLMDINRAREEIDQVRDVGLTVKFERIKPLITSEGILEWFGATGEFYVITTILDGSGRRFEYTTQYFQKIKRDEFFPLGTGGILVGFIQNPHWFIDIHMLVMESDSDIRNFGKFIEEAKKEAKLDDLLKFVGTAAAFDPTMVSQVVTGVNLFLAALTHILKANGDDYIGSIHDFYLKHQRFGEGRHPKQDLKRFQNVEAAYTIDLTKL
jgi:hypothetical protein